MLAAHMDYSEQTLAIVSEFWNSPSLCQQPGLKAIELFDAVAEGQIKAIWIMGTNPVDSLPNADKVKAALENCETVIVSDCIAETDTTLTADILLPATGWGEKDGTVTNSERRISRQRSLVKAPGEARHDWWIMTKWPVLWVTKKHLPTPVPEIFLLNMRRYLHLKIMAPDCLTLAA